MNKIYALKYCYRTGTAVPVPEFCNGRTKSATKKLLSLTIFMCLFSDISLVYAGMVGSDVSYQTYRDFSENKGIFVPGARDIRIYAKDGSIAGELNKAPLPDFSSVNFGSGVATLISPQYISSVKHNGSYKTVSFGNGQNSYSIVDRNNHPSQDFHAPRLNKLVTEVVPASINYAPRSEILDTVRFPEFYRIGSGSQVVQDKDGHNVTVSGAYNYLTGGTTALHWGNHSGNGIQDYMGDNINKYKPIGNFGLPGDSGSPLFGWDAKNEKWVMTGVYAAIGGSTRLTNPIWALMPTKFIEDTRSDDNEAPILFDSIKNNPLYWNFDPLTGTGTLVQDGNTFIMHGQKGKDLNAGKNLIFDGENGKIILHSSVSQGAGSLTFNSSYTVSTDNDSTWQGAGLDIRKGNEVDWKVNGVQRDNLHKTGAGILRINGTGINEGGLKTGDGTVILSQMPDKNGLIQAFSSVNISSGRPVVILSDDRQVNPDNISWGFRGGVLDINGSDISFHEIKAADNGAIITNNSQTPSLLTISPLTDMSVSVNDWDKNKRSGGEEGLLYKYRNGYTRTVDYFFQKKKGYGYFPVKQSSNSDWEYVGHDEQAAKKWVLSRRPKDNLLFHGNLTGNINVRTDTSASTGDMAFDGNINIPQGIFSQSGGNLTFQGHPVIHAYNSKAIADKLASLGDHSVRIQPVSFDQPDWENRVFTLKMLELKDTDFRLARNATMNGSINANHSVITLGSPSLYIDKNDGTGKKANVPEGISVASNASDMSTYLGNVTLNNHSRLDIRETFSGGIAANDSSISVTSRQAVLNEYSMFRKTPLALQGGAHLTATGGWYTDNPVSINHDATLSLGGSPRPGNSGYVSAAYYASTAFSLEGDNARLQVLPWTFTYGDISADGNAVISVGEGSSASLAPDLSFREKIAYSTFYGFKNVYGGRVYAPRAQMSLSDTQWQISGNSTLGSLQLTRSLAGFTGGNFISPLFHTLNVDRLAASQSAFALRTDLKNSDNIVIKQHAEGKDNTLFVNFLRKPSDRDTLNIPLVSAPVGTDPGMFKAAERVTGFSMVTPRIHTVEDNGMMRWVLDGFDVRPDKRASFSANTFLNMGYKNFLTEVNNLNKRMGDLRDTQGEDGLWARVMNGAGTGDGGYSDSYTHFQFGFDRKHRLSGADLFTGVLISHTDSHGGSSAFSGETRSLGGGVYTSLILDSGAYVDLIGKYVHHDNNYTARFIGPDKQNYGTHSWYAGVETGYRYRLSDDMYIEPQAELVYGAVSGSRFNWNADGMDMSMANKHYNPLTGRTGVAFGKTFTGKDWQVTARTGVDYQFDLVSNGETALRDASGEHRFNGEKDSRILYNVGVNARLKDNIRFGVELEQSAFGQYNVDHLINANIRYIF
ncbi:autotransporter outer membrane beta-barrel domain-containing protein [Salmonella enterica]|nr:autotransporter outer membrane beta-barrel domain-containing protein [Salmonella enterica]